MYYEPNERNGREVRNHNVLIYLYVDVNGEVKDLRRKFNIIYIMRTHMQVCGLYRPGLIHGVSPVANQASANCSCR